VKRGGRAGLPSRTESDAALTRSVGCDDQRRTVLAACQIAVGNLGGAAMGAVGVTGSVQGEGRTTVATGLALAASARGARTLLVELNGDQPVLASRLGLRASPGVAELLARSAELDTCLQVVSGVDVVVAGAARPAPGSLIDHPSAPEFLDKLRAEFDVVVADLPIVTRVAAGSLYPEMFDSVLLVVRGGLTTRAHVRRSVEALGQPPAVMLNGANSAIPSWLARAIGA
jgi:Mrp family chromosome partitioning ATPase